MYDSHKITFPEALLGEGVGGALPHPGVEMPEGLQLHLERVHGLTHQHDRPACRV